MKTMNHRDTENLRFLLGISDKARDEWFRQASADDILYASELLERYNKVLNEKILLNSDEVSDTMQESKDVLKRFMK